MKNYSVQTGAPSTLLLRDGDTTTFAVGNTIIVSGWLARDGTNHLVGLTIKTADGKILASTEPRARDQ